MGKKVFEKSEAFKKDFYKSRILEEVPEKIAYIRSYLNDELWLPINCELHNY